MCGVTGRRNPNSSRHARIRNVIGPQQAVTGFTLESITNDTKWQEVVLLFPQDESQAIHFGFRELSVARTGPFGIDESLTFKKPDLGDGDVGKLLGQHREHFSDGV
jgi:hypothetical protein